MQASGGLGGVGTQFYGTIYGPRGSWLTGSLQLAVNANLDIKPLPTAPARLRSWLVQ